MNKPFTNLSDQNFMHYGCLSGDIEDNIKLGPICPQTLSCLVQFRVTALGVLLYDIVAASHIGPNAITRTSKT